LNSRKFLSTLTSEEYQNLLQVVAIGKMKGNVTGDTSIQAIEDTLYELSKENYKVLHAVMKHCQGLAFYGSEKVQHYCEDMVSVVLDKEFVVAWESHTPEVVNTKDSWINNKGVVIGWESRVSDDERAKFFILSAQYSELIKQLKAELKINT
jgi:hypothetical protein